MTDLSPELRAFLLGAIPEHVATLRRNGVHPPAELRAELLALVEALGDESRRLEMSSLGVGSSKLDGGAHGNGLAVSRREAARLLGVSLSTVGRLTASGELPKVRVGRRVLIARSDIESFLRRRGGAETARPDGRQEG